MNWNNPENLSHKVDTGNFATNKSITVLNNDFPC